MWKWVVRDYFAAFRWGKFKEWLKTGWWSILYFGLLMPLSLQLFEEPKEMVIYTCIVVPYMCVIISCNCHSMALPKVMYLCPMTEAQRQKYVEKSCILQIGVGGVLGGIMALVLWVTGFCNIVEAGILLFDSFSLAIALCGFGRVKPDERTKERMKLDVNTPLVMLGGIETLTLIFAMCSAMGMYIVICWETPVFWWVKWIFVGVAVLIQLPLTLRLLRNWDVTIRKAASYEESYL